MEGNLFFYLLTCEMRKGIKNYNKDYLTLYIRIND